MTAFSLVHVFFALQNDNTLVDKHHLFMAVLIHYYHGNIMHQFILTKNKWNACKNVVARSSSKSFMDGGSAYPIQIKWPSHLLSSSVVHHYHVAVANKILIQ